MKRVGLVAVLFGCFFASNLLAQENQVGVDPIVFHGSVYDNHDSSVLPSAIVINKRTSTGQSVAPGAQFTIAGLKTDTFLVTSGGYEVRRICFRDSILKSSYTVRIGLQIKSTTLTAVAIYPIKDLSEIQKERAAIGVVPTRQTVGLTDAVSSPITYFYERYSRDGKSRQAVAILENNDRKRAVLQDLFRTYARAGVITMDDSEFDAFIAYLNLSDDFFKNASDYELATYIRQRFLQYKSAQQIHNRNQR